MRKFPVGIVLLVTIPILVSACQGLYVAGDAGPHSTRATTEPSRLSPPRNR